MLSAHTILCEGKGFKRDRQICVSKSGFHYVNSTGKNKLHTLYGSGSPQECRVNIYFISFLPIPVPHAFILLLSFFGMEKTVFPMFWHVREKAQNRGGHRRNIVCSLSVTCTTVHGCPVWVTRVKLEILWKKMSTHEGVGSLLIIDQTTVRTVEREARDRTFLKGGVSD